MVGWYHQLSGHVFEKILGDSEGQGSLACCSSWGSQRVQYKLASEQEEAANHIMLFTRIPH